MAFDGEGNPKLRAETGPRVACEDQSSTAGPSHCNRGTLHYRARLPFDVQDDEGQHKWRPLARLRVHPDTSIVQGDAVRDTRYLL